MGIALYLSLLLPSCYLVGVGSMKQRLIVRSVEAVEKAERDVIVWDTELKGFGLKVTPKGKRTFFLYYRTPTAQRRPTIGSYPSLKPEKAREIARSMLADIHQGGDPSLKKKQARDRAKSGEGLLNNLFADYQKAKAGLRSMGEITRIFQRDILPALGTMRAEDVKRSDVSKMLDKLSERSPTVASNARKRLSAFYNWALPRLPDNAVNPVAGSVSAPPPAARERVLSANELTALWKVLGDEEEPWRTALRLLILTGQRRGEVFDAAWSEFDLDGALWTIPAARAKNGKVHLVPLAPQVVDLLRALPRNGRVFANVADAKRFVALSGCSATEVAGARWQEFDLAKNVWRLSKKRSATRKAVEVVLSPEACTFLHSLGSEGMVFPGTSRAYSRSARRISTALDKELGAPAPTWSWHDLRRTVATGLQRLGVRLEVTEAVLNHVSGTRAGMVGIYQRHHWFDEKRVALVAWANEVFGVKPAGDVVQFRRA